MDRKESGDRVSGGMMSVDLTLDIKLLKPLLYDLLMSACETQPNDNAVSMKQGMGVNLSNSVKKEGVNIIQIQTARLDTMVPKLVEAMQMVDMLVEGQQAMIQKREQPIMLEATCEKIEDVDEQDVIERFCEAMYEDEKKLQEIKDLIVVRYVEYLESRLGTKKEAFGFSHTTPTIYYHAKNKLEV